MPPGVLAKLWIRHTSPRSLGAPDDDESSEEEGTNGAGKEVAVERGWTRALNNRRKQREEAEGIVRIQDDSTDRKQAARRQRESDGADEGEKEKEDAKKQKEEEIAKRKEEEKKEAKDTKDKIAEQGGSHGSK